MIMSLKQRKLKYKRRIKLNHNIYIRYCLDISFFDLWHLNAKTKWLHQLIQEALFVNDYALLTHKDNNLQMMLNKIHSQRHHRPSV